MNWRRGILAVSVVAAVASWMAGCSRARPAAAADPLRLVAVTGADVGRLVRGAGGEAVLVNLWATWCVPCREEMPAIVNLRRQYAGRGLKVVLVSWDTDPGVARRFLAAQGVDFATYWKSDDERDPAFIEAFEPKWSGAFPATFIYDGQGRLRSWWEGKRPYTTFEAKVLEVLNRKETDR